MELNSINFNKLTDNIINLIESYLRYEDILRLRLCCKLYTQLFGQRLFKFIFKNKCNI